MTGRYRGRRGRGGRDGEITEDVWAEDRAEISHRGVWVDGESLRSMFSSLAVLWLMEIPSDGCCTLFVSPCCQ